MNITCFGAAHEVTGSCYLFEIPADDGRVLRFVIDCGMFQGSDFNEGKNHDAFPFDPGSIDAVLVTHAHLDHTGRIPKLVRDGFRGPIYMTKATTELAPLIWDDAYGIMAYNHRKFQSPILYDESDIERATARCQGVDYREPQTIAPGVTAVWKDAGHIFGAAFIEITAHGKTVVFSGDIGNSQVPILRETDQLGSPDVLVCESTYGDRLHEGRKESRALLQKLIHEGHERGGTIMIPAFSLERIQELLYELNQMSEYDKTLPRMPVFLDSPLAIAALPVYKKYAEYYNHQATALKNAGDDFFQFPGLVITRTKEESQHINFFKGPKMVIAGAGMMNGGRILHHAYRYLSDPNSTLIITGYQAEGTLGRRLYEGAEHVTIFGETIPVRCTIKAIGGLSAHADQAKLLSWVRSAESLPKKVYFTHGEPTSATVLAHRFRDELGVKTFVPANGDTIEIE